MSEAVAAAAQSALLSAVGDVVSTGSLCAAQESMSQSQQTKVVMLCNSLEVLNHQLLYSQRSEYACVIFSD